MFDSPHTGATGLTPDFDLGQDEGIVVDFDRFVDKEDKDIKHRFTWMEEQKFNEITELRQVEGDGIVREKLEAMRVVKRLYGFQEQRYVYFCDPLNKFTQSFDYSQQKEWALVNNQLYSSQLSFDFDNELHYFSVLKGVYKSNQEICSSTGFFESRFPNLILSTTMNSKVSLFDLNKKKPVLNWESKGVISSKAWDNIYCLYDDSNKLVLFDVRDSISPILTINCATKNNLEGPVMCNDMQKFDNKLLISTNLETFSYDIRETFNKTEGKSPIFTGKRRSYTFQEDIIKDIAEATTKLNCRKSHFINNGKAIIADFVNTTVDLHNLNEQKIEKSLFFGNCLYDVSFNKQLKKIAVLLENKEKKTELAIFNYDLSLHNIYTPEEKGFNKLGFIGTEGKILLHSKNDFEVVDINHPYTDLINKF